MLKKDLSSADFYEKSVKNPLLPIKVAEKWSDILEVNIDEDFITKIFDNIKIITLSTKLRSFHFRLLHNAITTNEKMLLWKLRDDDLCTFCGLETENILHLLLDCQAVKLLWNQLKHYCLQKANRNIDLNTKKIIFCQLSPKPFDCINTMCLITLQYIYSCRCLKVIPNFACLKTKILDIQNIEKYIATKNDKMKKHNAKWKGF